MMRQWWIVSTLAQESVTETDVKLRVIPLDEVAEMPEADQEHFNVLLSLRNHLQEKENTDV